MIRHFFVKPLIIGTVVSGSIISEMLNLGNESLPI